MDSKKSCRQTSKGTGNGMHPENTLFPVPFRSLAFQMDWIEHLDAAGNPISKREGTLY
jgi:hypothetical protein